MIMKYLGKQPKLGKEVFIAEGAKVIGDVTLGDHASVWFNAVVRGDVHYIKIGAYTNVQDNSVLHVTTSIAPLNIGKNVTVGHNVILHGCTIEDNCMIGSGAIIWDGAVIKEGSMVGAGAVVLAGFEAPPRSLILGTPAKFKKEIPEEQSNKIIELAVHYSQYAQNYLKDRT